MDIELVTDPEACMMYIVSPLAVLGGGILWQPTAYNLLLYELFHTFCPFTTIAIPANDICKKSRHQYSVPISLILGKSADN